MKLVKCDCYYANDCNVGDGRQKKINMSKYCQWYIKVNDKVVDWQKYKSIKIGG